MSQSEGLDMNTFNFVIFLIFLAMTSGQEKDFSEKDTPSIFQASETHTESDSSSPAKATEKTFKIPTQQRPAATPNRTPFPQHKFSTYRPTAIPNLGFSPSPTRTIYLSDPTGEYDLRLHNFRGGQPSDFQAALGAISAHILNQRNNGEYVPYPPNGNPYNYHRQRPFGAEPPATGAYERGSRSDYDVPADVDYRVVYSGEYRPGIPSEGFYGSYFEQKTSRPFNEY